VIRVVFPGLRFRIDLGVRFSVESGFQGSVIPNNFV